MSTAILDRPQGRSDEGPSSAISPARPVEPARRRTVGRPTTRQAPIALPAARPAVGCAGVAGGQTMERGYRMGRGARLTVTLSVLATALILTFGGGSTSAGSTVDVVTTSGQTVWSIARDAVGPDASPAAVGAFVDRIRSGNALEDTAAGAALPVGLTLHLPTG